MPPRVSWSNLLPGVIAIGVLVAIALSVLLFAGVGQIHGKTMRVYALTSQAQGVLAGTEVWLAGQKVGAVERIEFRPPDADTAMRIVLVLTVAEKDADQIRKNSVASIRTGGSVVGPAIVHIGAGTPDAPALRDGDTLRASPPSDVSLASAKLSNAMDDVGLIVADAKTILGQWRQRDGGARVVRSLVEEHNGEVATLRNNVSRLRSLTTGMDRVRDVAAQARVTLARVDSIRVLVNSPATSFGRWRRDSTLATTVASLRVQLDTVSAAMASVHGNIGRASQDSAITRALLSAQLEMKLLFEDMRRRPARYIAF